MECLFCYKLTFDNDDNVPLTCPGPDGKTIVCSTLSKIFQIENTEFLSTPICQDCTGKLLNIDRMLLEIKGLQLKINRVKDDLFGGLIKCQHLSEMDGKSCGNRVKLIEEINASLKNGHGEDNDFPFFNLDFGNYNQLLNQNSAMAADDIYDGSQDQGGDDFFDHQQGAGQSTYDNDDNDYQEDTNLMQHYSSNIIPKNLPVLRIILEPIQVPNYMDNQVSFNINEESISSFIQRDAKKVKEIQSQRKEIFNQKNSNSKTIRSREGSKPKMKLPLPPSCHLCNMKFSSRRSLNRHKQFQHPEFKTERNNLSLECQKCNMKFSCRGSLGRHRRKQHPESKTMSMVKHSEEPTDTSSFIQRGTKKVEEIQSMDNLEENIDISKTMSREGSKPIMKSPLSLECQICNMNFSCRGSLGRHRRKQHPETKAISKVKHGEESISSFIQSDTKKVKEIQLQSMDIFEQNIDTDTTDISKTMSSEVLKPKPKPRGKLPSISIGKSNTKSKLPLECHLCNNMKFSCRGSLNRHRRHKHPETRIIRKEATIECLICHSKFSSRKSLYIHKKNKHPESLGRDRRYKDKVDGEINETLYCDQCPRSFALRSQLRLHIKRHHCPPVKCTYENCDKIFKNMNTLKFHIISVHRSSGEDHPCSECSKTFAKNWLLSYHVKIVHSGQKWICELCSRVLTSKINLKSHVEAIHKKNYKYFCSEPECNGRGFRRSGDFRRHMERIHQKLREVECPSCPPGTRKFYNASGLKVHTMYSHSGERPYMCQYCSKGFVTMFNVRLHEKIHLETNREVSSEYRKRKPRLAFGSNL